MIKEKYGWKWEVSLTIRCRKVKFLTETRRRVQSKEECSWGKNSNETKFGAIRMRAALWRNREKVFDNLIQLRDIIRDKGNWCQVQKYWGGVEGTLNSWVHFKAGTWNVNKFGWVRKKEIAQLSKESKGNSRFHQEATIEKGSKVEQFSSKQKVRRLRLER